MPTTSCPIVSYSSLIRRSTAARIRAKASSIKPPRLESMIALTIVRTQEIFIWTDRTRSIAQEGDNPRARNELKRMTPGSLTAPAERVFLSISTTHPALREIRLSGAIAEAPRAGASGGFPLAIHYMDNVRDEWVWSVIRADCSISRR